MAFDPISWQSNSFFLNLPSKLRTNMASRNQEIDFRRQSDPRVDSVNEELKLRGMSKQALCKAMGTNDYSSINKILNGMKPLTDKMLRRIAEALELPKAYFEGERELKKDQEPLTRKGYKLMSDILTRVPEMLQRLEKEIDDKKLQQLHDFFFNEPTRPLIATGHGGKYPEAVYAALLYGTYQGLGRAVTCYSCNSLSDATIKNSKILLVSKGMANIDINHITERCIELNPEFTCAPMIEPDKNYKPSAKEKSESERIRKKLDKKCRYTFMFDNFDVEDGFIGVGSVYYYEALFYMAFTGDRDFVRKLNFNPIASENYTYESAHKIASVPSLEKIKHFTILYGSYAEPVAHSVDNTIVEGGMAACMVQDYKNYTHGRFIMDGNFIKSKNYPYTEAALICLVTPREENIYQQLIDAMPIHLPIITIRTEHFTPLATLDLLYKANMFVSELAEKYHRTNPCDPNPNGVDKQKPKNGVDFKQDFERYGALDHEADKQLMKEVNDRKKVKFDSLTELFKARDEILQKEAVRTEQAKENWKSAKPLTFDDFSFRTTHTYDTMKRECWSFNSRTDVRDGVELKLGNMGNDFGVRILGIDFPNSEVPYQLAIFDNSQKSVEIQKTIIDPQNGWISNGLKMKRKFIKSEAGDIDEYWKYRRDIEFEKGKQLWCYEWMKWVVWEKVKQNKGFRKILLSIPKDAVIIEQAQREKDTQWGAWNDELFTERGIVTKSAEIENGVGKNSKAVRDVTYLVNNVGEFVGENAMGQILTMCKLALYDRVELPIDETLLNDANINWFGQVLRFTKEADGRVTVRTMTPRLRLIPSLGIMGAICGDMLGSVYEYDKKGSTENRDKALKLATAKKLNLLVDMSFTDDTVLTLAVAKWLMEDSIHSKDTLIDLIKDFGTRFKPKTFSDEFKTWRKTDNREPYASGEDGCAMRVSPIAYYAKTLKQCLELAKISAEVTHNGEEGIRGAQAVAATIFLFLHGKTKEEIKHFISEQFPMYDLNRTVDEIRPTYGRLFNCDNVVPESIICFLEGKDYEDTVKLSISLGGDTDTMGSISGAMAAAQMEIPQQFAEHACKQLPLELRKVLSAFYSRYKVSSNKQDIFEIPLDENPIPTKTEDVDEEEAELLIAESPANEDAAEETPQEAILKPTRASKRKVKEIPTEEKKTSQEVRNQADSSDGKVRGIIGAVIGEVIGSRFEFSKPPTRKVDRFTAASTFTDDTVLTVAVADALQHDRDFGEAIFEWARKYPNAGFGARFRKLMKGKKDIPTDSIGNGSGMRVSPIGFHAKTLYEALDLAKQSAIPSHNSVEGIKGAQSIAAATFMAKQQRPKDEIKAYIEKEFGYNLSLTDEEIKTLVSIVREEEKTEWAENTCPLAIIAFLTTDDYESSIWKAISYGCDTDTVACMTGGISAAYYGVPTEIINEAVDYLPREILSVINEFDHTNLQNRRITPKKYDRWGATLVYGSGSENITNEKGHIVDEGGFDARQHFGAKLEVKEGFRKHSYAIPTVGKSLDEIKEGIDRFIEYAENHQEETFMVILIGCINAGFTPKQIAPMFERAKTLTNVYLPLEFIEVPETWEKKTRTRKKKVIEDSNIELTEANKQFKEEILAIKSGVLLDELQKG